MFSMVQAQIAQSVEQGIENPRVGGSIPPLGTISHLVFLNFQIHPFLISTDKINPFTRWQRDGKW